MFIHVLEARYVRDYKVWLRFSDGTSGEVDLAEELDGPVFGPLRDVERFKSFQLIGNTIAWENGADFAPEFLKQQVRIAA